MGIGAQIISHANVFAITGATDCSSVVTTLSPNAVSAFSDTESLLNGVPLGACSVNSDVGWAVPYAFTPRPAALVKANALAKAGAGKISTNITGTGSIVVPPGKLLPTKGNGGVQTDTSLLIGFDDTPTLGTSGTITVRRATTSSWTRSIFRTRRPLPIRRPRSRANLEIDDRTRTYNQLIKSQTIRMCAFRGDQSA